MENMSRKEMCDMLCNMGHDMLDLQMCSNKELQQMCSGGNMNKDVDGKEMMENTMSRKEMCDMLCNMGHDMQELQMCSNNELMQMCGGNMNYDADYTAGNEITENNSNTNYMFFANLKAIKRLVDEMLSANENEIDTLLTDGHNWALDHIATSKDDIEEVYGLLMDRNKNNVTEPVIFMQEKLHIKKWKDFN